MSEQDAPRLLCSCGGDVEVRKTRDWCKAQCAKCGYVFLHYYSRSEIAETVTVNGKDLPPFIVKRLLLVEAV